MKTCVLLSTAGSLLSHHRGQFIDGHDVVIRTGQGPIRGYESHVGSRTTYRIMTVSLFDPRYRINVDHFSKDVLRNETLVYTHHTHLAPGCRMEKYHSKYKISNAYQCMPDRIQCKQVPRTRRDFSTGFRSAFFAWENLRCDVLNLLGFNTTENIDLAYHYWKDGSKHDGVRSSHWYNTRKHSKFGHDFYKEHLLIQEIKERIIKFGFDVTCRSFKASV